MIGIYYLPQFYKVKRLVKKYTEENDKLTATEKKLIQDIVEGINEDKEECAVNDIVEAYMMVEIIFHTYEFIDRMSDLHQSKKTNIKKELNKELAGCYDTMSKNFKTLQKITQRAKTVNNKN